MSKEALKGGLRDTLRVSPAWAGVIVVVLLALTSAYINLEKSLSYNRAIAEMQALKLDLAQEKQNVLVGNVHQGNLKLVDHEVRITNNEYMLKVLNK